MSIPGYSPLADFCSIVQGGRHRLSGNDFVEDGYPAYGAGGMNGLLPIHEFDRAGVVLSSIGARCGKCFFVEGRWASLANTQVILPDLAKADVRFLWHQLNDEKRWPRSGTAQPFIKPSDVKAHQVFLPDLDEQRRIAAILDEADALRAKRRAALAQLDEMAQAIFVEMFGDLQRNSKQWPVRQCVDICIRMNVGVVIKPASYYCEDGVPAIRGTNIKPHGIDLNDLVYFSEKDSNGPLAKSRLNAGDLVIIRTGQPGLCAIVPPNLDGANAIDVIIVTLDTRLVNVVFMRELLNSPGGRAMVLSEARGQIQQHFNVGSLAAASLIVPPIAIQQNFADRIEANYSLRASTVASLADLDSLFASLQHRAFRGEL